MCTTTLDNFFYAVLLFCFRDRLFLYSLGYPGIYSVKQANLKFTVICLPLSLISWALGLKACTSTARLITISNIFYSWSIEYRHYPPHTQSLLQPVQRLPPGLHSQPASGAGSGARFLLWACDNISSLQTQAVNFWFLCMSHAEHSGPSNDSFLIFLHVSK